MVMGSGFFEDYEESGQFKYPGGKPPEEDDSKNKKKNGGKKVAVKEEAKNKKKNGENKNGQDATVLTADNQKEIDQAIGSKGIDVKDLSKSSGTSSAVSDSKDFDPNTVPYSELLKKIPEEFHRRNPDGQVMGHAANYNPFARDKDSPHGRFYDPETKTSYALDKDLKPDMDKPLDGARGKPDEPSGSEMLTSVSDANESVSFPMPGDEDQDGDFEYNSDVTLEFDGDPDGLEDGAFEGLETLGAEDLAKGGSGDLDAGFPGLADAVAPVGSDSEGMPDLAKIGNDQLAELGDTELGETEYPELALTDPYVSDRLPVPTPEKTTADDTPLSGLRVEGVGASEGDDLEGLTLDLEDLAMQDAIADEMAYDFEDGDDADQAHKEALGGLAKLWSGEGEESDPDPADKPKVSSPRAPAADRPPSSTGEGGYSATELGEAPVSRVYSAFPELFETDTGDIPDDPEQTSGAFVPVDQKPPSALNPTQLIQKAFLDEESKQALIMRFRKENPEFYDSNGNFKGGELPGELGGARWSAYQAMGPPGFPQATIDDSIAKATMKPDTPTNEADFVKAFLIDRVENEIFQDAVKHHTKIAVLSSIPGPLATIYTWKDMGPKMRMASVALDAGELLALRFGVPIHLLRGTKAPTTAAKIVAAGTATKKYIAGSLEAYDAALGLTGSASVSTAVKHADTSKNIYIDALQALEDVKAHGRYPREAGAGYTAAGVLSEAEYARRLKAAQEAVGFAAEGYAQNHDKVVAAVKASTNEFGEGGELANLAKGSDFPTSADNLLEIKNAFYNYVDVFPEVRAAAKKVDDAYDSARVRIAEYAVQGWEPGPSIAEPVKDILAAHKALREANNVQATILKSRIKSLQDDLDAGVRGLDETHAVKDEIRSLHSQIKGLNALDGADLQKMDEILTDVMKTFKGEPETWQIPVLLAHDAVTQNKKINLKQMEILWAEGFDPDAPWGSGGIGGGKGPAIFDATKKGGPEVGEFDWGLGGVKAEGAGGSGAVGLPTYTETPEAPDRWSAGLDMFGTTSPESEFDGAPAVPFGTTPFKPSPQYTHDPSDAALGELASRWSEKEENIGISQPTKGDATVAKDAMATDVTAANELVQEFPTRVKPDSSEFEGAPAVPFGTTPFKPPKIAPALTPPPSGVPPFETEEITESGITTETETAEIPTIVPEPVKIIPEPVKIIPEPVKPLVTPKTIPQPKRIPPSGGPPDPDPTPVRIPVYVPSEVPPPPPPPDEGEEEPTPFTPVRTIPAPEVGIGEGPQRLTAEPIPEATPIEVPETVPVPEPIRTIPEGEPPPPPPPPPPEEPPSVAPPRIRPSEIFIPSSKRKTQRKSAKKKTPSFPRVVGWKQGKVYGYQDLVSGKSYYSANPLYNKLPRGMNLKPLDTLQVVKRGSTRPRKRQFTLGDTVVRVGKNTITFTEGKRRGRRA